MDEGTFNRCVEFVARLAHSDLHNLMGMAKPCWCASFIACPTVRAWHGANHALGSCFSTPKPTKPAPSALQKPSASGGLSDAAAAHLTGGEGSTPRPSPQATKPAPAGSPPLQSPPGTQSGAPTPAAVAHNISPSSNQSPAPCSSPPSTAHMVSPDENSAGTFKRPPTSPPRCPLPNAKKPKDKVLANKLLPDIKCWWIPAEGATGKLMCDMDKPIAT